MTTWHSVSGHSTVGLLASSELERRGEGREKTRRGRLRPPRHRPPLAHQHDLLPTPPPRSRRAPAPLRPREGPPSPPSPAPVRPRHAAPSVPPRAAPARARRRRPRRRATGHPTLAVHVRAAAPPLLRGAASLAAAAGGRRGVRRAAGQPLPPSTGRPCGCRLRPRHSRFLIFGSNGLLASNPPAPWPSASGRRRQLPRRAHATYGRRLSPPGPAGGCHRPRTLLRGPAALAHRPPRRPQKLHGP